MYFDEAAGASSSWLSGRGADPRAPIPRSPVGPVCAKPRGALSKQPSVVHDIVKYANVGFFTMLLQKMPGHPELRARVGGSCGRAKPLLKDNDLAGGRS